MEPVRIPSATSSAPEPVLPPAARAGAEAVGRESGRAGARAGTQSGAPPSTPPPVPAAGSAPVAVMGRLLGLLPRLSGSLDPAVALGGLEALASRAGSAADPAVPAAAARELLARAFRPGTSGADLRIAIRASVGDPTALLGLLSGAEAGQGKAGLEALTHLLLATVESGPSLQATPAELVALDQALTLVARQAPASPGAPVVAWVNGIADALFAALGSATPRLRRALERGALRGREAAALRVLLGNGSLSPASRRALLGTALTHAEARETLQQCASGEGGDSLPSLSTQTQAGLEADRLLALLRQSLEGELRATLPVADGARLVPLHLFVRRDTDDEGAGAQGGGADSAWSVRLGVDLAALGPLDVELRCHQDHLSIRLRAERPSTCALLEQRGPDLRALLAAEGAEVSLLVLPAEVGALDLTQESARLPLDPDRRWVDLAG